MNGRILIQALLLVVWALMPALQSAVPQAPQCTQVADCACCEGKVCDCADTPERLPADGSQPALPADSGKQVSPPAVQSDDKTEHAPAAAWAVLPTTFPLHATVAASPVAPRLLYCRFLI